MTPETPPPSDEAARILAAARAIRGPVPTFRQEDVALWRPAQHLDDPAAAARAMADAWALVELSSGDPPAFPFNAALAAWRQEHTPNRDTFAAHAAMVAAWRIGTMANHPRSIRHRRP